MSKSLGFILGAIVIVVGGLFVIFKVSKKSTNETNAPAAAAVSPQPTPTNGTAQTIAAIGSAASDIAAGLAGLGIKF